MDYELINKYLNGDASEAEVITIFQWIDQSAENRKEFIGYKKIWALTAHSEGNAADAWNKKFKPGFGKQKILRSCFQFVRYAAILILVFGTGMVVQYLSVEHPKEEAVYCKNTTIHVPLGQMTNLELPDGSKVMLNSGSSIAYNGDFAKGNRTVSLSGEAYFDVVKDREHPFLIETSSLNFKVFGTSFNLEAYPNEQAINATLVEGSLGVMDKTDHELYRLKPDENARFDTLTSKISVSKVETAMYTSWKEGLITFRNEKLKDIARKIERWYNVEIMIGSPKLGEEAYFGTIMKNKPIDQLLEVLSLTSSLRYKIVTRSDQPTLIYWEVKY
jgi:ferric-dicitrate binding protein FerR (iron transport regulator)